MRKILIFIFAVLLFPNLTVSAASKAPVPNKRTIVIPVQSNPRIKFGAEKLAQALTLTGYEVKVVQKDKVPGTKELIVIGSKSDLLVSGLLAATGKQAGKEGFSIA